jgi:hypothetical protein
MQLQQAYLSCHVPVRLCLLRLAALLRGRLNLMSDTGDRPCIDTR